MKKLLALVLVVMLVMAMGTTSLAAVNITVTRDSTTYEAGGTSETGNRAYTYKQIFRATEKENHTSTGGGYDTDGTPGAVTTSPTTGITFYLNSTDTTQIGQLGTWSDSTTPKWTKATGNLWFDLTKSADGTRYTVTWANSASDTDTVQAAARWLDANYTALASGNLTAASDGKTWTASDLPEGYYLLKAETGVNLIAAPVDITVNEKNSYPTVDKKQKDKSDGTYADTAVNVKIGDTIYYQIEVKVPADANADIVVTDTLSAGLTYNTANAPEVKVGTTALTADAGSTKNDYVVGTTTATSIPVTIHPTTNTLGKTVVITFAATVNNTALTSVDRKNDVKIVYGNYQQFDFVEYDIGAAAIIKYDGDTATVSDGALTAKDSTAGITYVEATFVLKDSDGNAINVKEATSGTKGVYVVDTTATTNTVTSDKAHSGVILIYGLDPDVTYKLTETGTEAGYNVLDGDVTLTVVKAETTAATPANATKITVAQATGVYAGASDAAAANTLEISAADASDVANNQGTVLPSTGGIGTTLFYIIGGVLVAGAFVLLVTKRRMAAKN